MQKHPLTIILERSFDRPKNPLLLLLWILFFAGMVFQWVLLQTLLYLSTRQHLPLHFFSPQTLEIWEELSVLLPLLLGMVFSFLGWLYAFIDECRLFFASRP